MAGSEVPSSQERQFSCRPGRFDCELTTDFFTPTLKPGKELWLIVLNFTQSLFIVELWKRATHRVCADGGANRWFDIASKLPRVTSSTDARELLPDIICGDLDSLRDDVRQFYEQRGVRVDDLSEDQDTTDLTKSVNYINRKLNERGNCEDVIIVAAGALGGRLDHTLSNLHTLHCFPHLPLILLGEGNLARLLPRGKTRIRVDLNVEGRQCAVVPLNGPANCSSEGLKWNLDRTRMEFQGLISTSNLLLGEEVIIDVDQPVLWITQLRERDALNRMRTEASPPSN